MFVTKYYLKVIKKKRRKKLFERHFSRLLPKIKYRYSFFLYLCFIMLWNIEFYYKLIYEHIYTDIGKFISGDIKKETKIR